MPIEPVDSPDDPRLEDYRAMREGGELRRRGAFIAEGRLAVAALLRDDARFEPRSVLCARRLAPLALQLAGERALPVFAIDDDAIHRIVGFPFHRGILAAGERGPAPTAERLLRALPGGRCAVLCAEDLTDHDNVGSLFRNAAAFGASGVLLSDRCADPLYRKAIRTSIGHALRIPWARFGRFTDGLRALRAAGFTLAALTPADDAASIDDAARSAPPERIAMLLGGEGDGLSDGAQREADLRIRIPMAPGADSINVAAAAAVALHRLVGVGPGPAR